jgi:three-Cys-motif partner protein
MPGRPRIPTFQVLEGSMPPRPWHYWSENKLIVLADYLPAFATASKRAKQTIYLDLFAGEAVNISSATGQPLDGSAKIALKTIPQLTHIHLFEKPAVARRLERELRQEFPDRVFSVHPGDSNERLLQVLKELAPYRWSPTFAFVDQQGADVKWATLASIASFRPPSRTKAEIWMYWSPTFIGRGVRGTNGEAFAEQVDKMYGTTAWREIQRARDEDLIDPERYRIEMTNLIRWRLEKDLYYKTTHVLEMHMRGGADVIYVLIFATDHEVGKKIMEYLYKKAVERERGMRLRAQTRKVAVATGQESLFEISPELVGKSGGGPLPPPAHIKPWRPPTYVKLKAERDG